MVDEDNRSPSEWHLRYLLSDVLSLSLSLSLFHFLAFPNSFILQCRLVQKGKHFDQFGGDFHLLVMKKAKEHEVRMRREEIGIRQWMELDGEVKGEKERGWNWHRSLAAAVGSDVDSVTDQYSKGKRNQWEPLVRSRRQLMCPGW